MTALCYGCGYFSYHAHLTMLGLNGTVDFPHDQMLLEGAQFLLVLLSALLLDAFLGIVILIVAGLAWLIVRRANPVPLGARNVRQRAMLRYHDATIAHPHLFPGIVLLALAMLLGWHYDLYFETLKALGTAAHLLFAQVPPSACNGLEHADPGAVANIAAGIITRGETCRTDLQGEFTWLVEGYFLLLVIVALVMSRAGERLPGPVRTVVKASVGLYAGIYTLWLPVAYGILARAPIYPLADVALTGGGMDHGWLLSRNSDGLLLWRDASRSAIWYPPSRTGQVRVTAVGNIFSQGVGP